MCGRFAQYRTAIEYLDALRTDISDFRTGLEPRPISRYSVAPGTRVLLLNRQDDGLHLDPVVWGYLPCWARQAKRPPMINARVETAATSKMFRGIWKTGRALVIADGWYEWKKDPEDPKRKQPYFIRLKSKEPMFFAAIGQFRPVNQEPREDDGFVVITAASDAGMIDIHDRRPLVLTPDIAREWIDPELSEDRAAEIGREEGTPVDAFEWYAVSKAVGSVKSDGPDLLTLIVNPLL
ncbi:SOS response-associated peptidase family protein [uncultured Pseudomonas sp.]|uniref:SOS response-associated peptidase family protein n=1 Tax=uncultured Pseudomonas sp. TaxID=114707 RepID=UPI002587855B|nr:SOS response-associated peptidase family protein [uncultured Pseudomonas sp.]